MRVAVLGGTRFIGAAIVEALLAGGHEPLVIHRGTTERDDLPDVPHAHLHRHDTEALARALVAHGARALVDTCAYTATDADRAVAALPDGVRAVVLSSQDVYRAFHTLRTGAAATDPVPLDEHAALRTSDQRFLFRGEDIPVGVGVEDVTNYENLDVEARYGAVGGTVLRLPMVYGERDPLVREGFVLARLAVGRYRIPFGAGNLLWTRGYVRDVALAVRLALETPAASGQVLNIGERHVTTVAQWAREIAAAAGAQVELVPVPEELLPEDLFLTGTVHQHVLTDCTRAAQLLGWQHRPPSEAIAASVAWHLRHSSPSFDVAADDAALSAG